jgi:hypothetical protein
MKTLIRVVLLAGVCGLGVWLWTVLFPGPEKIVLKKVSSLATTATIDASDNNLTRAGKALKLSEFFSTDAEIVINIPEARDQTISGREEIKERALAGFASLSSLKVQFFDATATVAPDKQAAEVGCTARVSAGNSKDFGVQELRFQFRKMDGEWLVTRVETVQTLK